MEDSLRQYAVGTKYNGFEDETEEELKDDAVINAIIMDGHWPNIKDQLLSVHASRRFKGKECTKDNKVLLEFFLAVNDTNHTDKEKYDKVTFVIDGRRMDFGAQSEYLSSDDGFAWKKVREMVIRGNVITFCDFNSPAIGDHSDYLCALFFSSRRTALRRVITVIPNELIEYIAETAENVSMYVDSSELIDVNGGYKSFEAETRGFEIEGIQGFMKRVCHFFIDDTCFTDYCTAFYEKKLAQEKEIQEREEEKLEQEAKKSRSIFGRIGRFFDNI